MRKKKKLRHLSSKKKSKKQILMPDWMEYKPYSTFSAYDKYYVDLANEVLSIIQQHELVYFDVDQTLAYEKHLAIQITSLFEDFINEIGLWKAFVETNKELHGFYLPFYQEEYDPEYLNVADFRYFFWHQLFIKTEIHHDPFDKKIMRIGQQFYDLLEPKIEEAWTTAHYQKMLQTLDINDYFSAKDILAWLVTSSYLLQSDLGAYLKLKQEEIIFNDSYSAPIKAFMIMGRMDEVMFTKHSRFAALSAPQILAKMADINTKHKNRIINAADRRLHGIFLYKGEEKEHLLFEYPQLKRTFKVLKKSFNSVHEIKTQAGAMCTITEWGGDFWLTGGCVSIPADNKMLQNIKNDPQAHRFPVFYHTEEVRTSLLENAQKIEDAFLEFFGKPFCIFENQAQAQEAQQLGTQFYNHTVANETDSFLTTHPLRKDQLPITDSSLALAYDLGNGMLFSDAIPAFIDLLTKEESELYDGSNYTIFEYAIYTPPPIFDYIIKNYPTERLKKPWGNSSVNINMLPYYPFLQRMTVPNRFAIKHPDVVAQPGTY